MASRRYYYDLTKMPEVTPTSSEGEDMKTTRKVKDSRKGRRGGKKGAKKKANSETATFMDKSEDQEERSEVSEPNRGYAKNSKHSAPDDTFNSYRHSPCEAEELVDTPNGAIFETRKVNTGLPDLTRDGLFATVDIEPKTRILTEKPVVKLRPDNDSITPLVALFDQFSASVQQRIMELCPLPMAEAEILRNQVDRVVEKHGDFVKKLEARGRSTWTDEETRKYNTSATIISGLIKKWRIASRLLPNLMSLIDLPMDQRANLAANVNTTGLCLTISQITPSCVPNSFASYNPDRGFFTLQAIKPIQAGTEITVTPIGHEIWYNKAADRAEKMAPTLPTCFRCMCEACDPASPAFAMHEQSRSNLKHLAAILSMSAQRLHDGSGTHSDVETTISAVNATLRELARVGCVDTELVRWQGLLQEVKAKKGELDVALDLADSRLYLAEMLYGRDSEQYQPIAEEYTEIWDKTKEEKKDMEKKGEAEKTEEGTEEHEEPEEMEEETEEDEEDDETDDEDKDDDEDDEEVNSVKDGEKSGTEAGDKDESNKDESNKDESDEESDEKKPTSA